MKKWT